jgi:hypothetical protein
VLEEPVEEQDPEPTEEPVSDKETSPPVQDPAVQEVAFEEPAQEAANMEPAQEIFALKKPTEEPALPLLSNELLPPVIASWDSYRLESEFFTEETLDANQVAHLVAGLPGIEHVLIVRQHGAVLAGNLPPRLAEQLKTPGRNYEHLFHNWPNRVQQRGNERTQLITFQSGDEFLTATQAEDIFLITSHERPKLHPGVEDKLAVVTEELAKMYPTTSQSRS